MGNWAKTFGEHERNNCKNVWGTREGGDKVIVVWVFEPVFQNLPHSYTWPLKKRTSCFLGK